MMTQIWQIASGETGRNYTELFLKHDIMFMGPGDAGEYNKQAYPDYYGGLRQFCCETQEGDLVLLRSGYKVLAVGKVFGQYQWCSTFDDVYGWDLQHTWRVCWQDHLVKELKNIQSNSCLFEGRKQIPTFTRVHDDNIMKKIGCLLNNCTTSRELKDLPQLLPTPLSSTELGQELFSKGLPNEAVDKVLVAIERQRRLVKWYRQFGKVSCRPTEHEVVAHMILPLLLALGWSEQLLAVEWHRIDLAGFWGTPTTDKTCVLVCEAKGLGHGLQNVFQQAIDYTNNLNLKECQKILLTDGARLYLYEWQKGEWNKNPVGYLNVDKIRTNHIAPPGTNAVDTIMALTPAGVTRKI